MSFMKTVLNIYSILQKEGGIIQACWPTQDSSMTFKLLLTLLWGTMVIQHTLKWYTFKPLSGIEP